jgi:hypothetical protein
VEVEVEDVLEEGWTWEGKWGEKSSVDGGEDGAE